MQVLLTAVIALLDLLVAQTPGEFALLLPSRLVRVVYSEIQHPKAAILLSTSLGVINKYIIIYHDRTKLPRGFSV